MLKETLLKFFKLDGLLNHLNEYIETRIELVKYELKDDLARIITRMALVLILALFLTLCILFFSFSLAYILADYVGVYGGFAIVGGAYLFLIILIVVFRKSLSEVLEKEIKKTLHKQKHDEAGDRRPD
ncbi:MAG: phage holin family protein [Cyclobacteriaceae bacterium]|nr:phage holin family protein [Cyclobacteriaceae bacterium]